MAKNKKWSAAAKFEIVLHVLRCDTTLNELCKRYQVAPSQVHLWKRQFLDEGKDVFSKPSDKPAALKLEELEKKQTKLYTTIGELTVERDYLKKSWDKFQGSGGGR